jgi:DNA-binding NarL/FixJ family response regulator
MTPIRVLLADDQALIRAGFAAIISSSEDMDVVGEAIDGSDAVRQARSSRPDVVLTGIRMPGMDGIAACEQITADPDLATVRVLMLTTFEQDDYVVDAMRAGASGFLGKGAAPEELLDAVRVVAAGDALLSPAATRAVIRQVRSAGIQAEQDAEVFDVLTDREREMVVLAAAGLSNDEIAARLVLSPLTVKTHVNRAMAKVGARDRAQLVVLAYRSGLVSPTD